MKYFILFFQMLNIYLTISYFNFLDITELKPTPVPATRASKLISQMSGGGGGGGSCCNCGGDGRSSDMASKEERLKTMESQLNVTISNTYACLKRSDLITHSGFT